ncbi:MAG: DUF456 domain-containing protein [Bacteroidales bacterium]|nr:DUF456 domain-containing protein [Bacteroidales bacterium]
MEYLIFLLAVICVIVGIVGDVVPGLPGVPISYAAMLLLHFFTGITYSNETLIIYGVLCAVITIVDYFVPIWGTKKFGGTKAGVRGSTIGLVVGVVVLPILGIVIGPFGLIGILAGPFVGAYIGEKMSGVDDSLAWRSAIGSFVGFVAGTLLKVVYSIVVAVVVLKDIITSFF